MRKKFLSVLLCATMAVSMMAGCGKTETPDITPKPTEKPVSTPKPTPSPKPTEIPTPTPIPAEKLPGAFAHITFDGEDEGYKAVVQSDVVGNNDGATYGLADASVEFGYADGAVGKALYLDGKFGIDLNLEPTNTDAYTVSFWMNAARLSTFGPTLQMGYNMGRAADAGNNVTWLNVTQSEWGTNSAKIFPIVWSRNEASDAADGTDCWPWMYSFDDAIHGKKEWVMVTIVCSGEVQNGPMMATTVGAQYYVNGQLMYDSQKNYEESYLFEYTWDATLAPNIMKPGDSEFESLFGINYWDTVFKGFVDDLYVFDTALTPGQVTSLYQMGDPAVEPVAPETGEVTVDEEPKAQVVTTFAENAIATVGAPTCDNGFWTSWSDGYELADGATVNLHFNNYGSGLSNWHNWVLAFANTETKADLAPGADNYPGYAEYGVVRGDAFAWGFPSDPAFEYTWADWDAFLKLMKDADVRLSITRNGSDVAFTATITDADNEVYTYKMNATTAAAAGDPMYVFLTGEGCYIELLSAQVIAPDTTAVQTVGTPALDNGFWTLFSDGYELKNGGTVKLHFNNYGACTQNWENFVTVLTNAAVKADLAPNADNYAGYVEYGVFRADAYGWAFPNEVKYETTWGDDWNEFLRTMLDADITLTATRANGGDIVFDFVIFDNAGKQHNYKVTTTIAAGAEDPVYFFLTSEKTYIEILSVE